MGRPIMKVSNSKQVLPKVIWEERVATPHGREWTRPLRVLSAIMLCYAVPTADESSHSAGGMHATSTPQCHMRLISYIAPFDPPPKRKKFVSSLTGNILVQSFRWHNGTIKTAVLSQRCPCDAPYIGLWVPWKFLNVHRKFEMRSLSRSWNNSDWRFGWGVVNPNLGEEEVVGGRGWDHSKERWWLPICPP